MGKGKGGHSGFLLGGQSSGHNSGMPRTIRASVGGVCYHVLNRSNASRPVFHKWEDFAVLASLWEDAYERLLMRLLGWCLAESSPLGRVAVRRGVLAANQSRQPRAGVQPPPPRQTEVKPMILYPTTENQNVPFSFPSSTAWSDAPQSAMALCRDGATDDRSYVAVSQETVDNNGGGL